MVVNQGTTDTSDIVRLDKELLPILFSIAQVSRTLGFRCSDYNDFDISVQLESSGPKPYLGIIKFGDQYHTTFQEHYSSIISSNYVYAQHKYDIGRDKDCYHLMSSLLGQFVSAILINLDFTNRPAVNRVLVHLDIDKSTLTCYSRKTMANTKDAMAYRTTYPLPEITRNVFLARLFPVCNDDAKFEVSYYDLITKLVGSLRGRNPADCDIVSILPEYAEFTRPAVIECWNYLIDSPGALGRFRDRH